MVDEYNPRNTLVLVSFGMWLLQNPAGAQTPTWPDFCLCLKSGHICTLPVPLPQPLRTYKARWVQSSLFPCPGLSPALHVSIFPRLSAWLVSGLRWSLISFLKPSLIFKAEQITSFIYCLFNPLCASMREKIMFLFLQLKFLIHCVALGRWLINICWI